MSGGSEKRPQTQMCCSVSTTKTHTRTYASVNTSKESFERYLKPL